MKKLIHLGMIAIIAINVSSCSKSAKDLVVNEKAPNKESASLSLGKHTTLPDYFFEGGSTIYPLIYQPVRLKLGDPNYNLSPGSIAVFFILLAPEFANDPASVATFITRDNTTGEIIQSYNLIPDEEADSYGVLVPDELTGQPFMFAYVELGDNYTDRTVALYSEITVNESTTIARMDHAFSVSFFINPK